VTAPFRGRSDAPSVEVAGRVPPGGGRALDRAEPAYLTSIDSLRAIAVLAVVAYHLDAALLPGGFVGVDMFFAISGFVVSRSVGLRPVQPLGAWLAGFYARRIVRILPAVWVCLLLSTLATVLVVPYAYLSGTIQRTGLAAFFGFSNVVLAANANDYFSPLAEFNSFTQTWSLGVEEQYYLVFPFIFVFYVLGKPRIAGWSLVAIAALSLGLAAQAMATAPARAFFLITDRFWELAAGAICFQATRGLVPRRGARVGVILSLLAIAAALITTRPDATPMPGAILPVCGALGFMVCSGALAPSSGLARLLARRWPVAIGRMSYSLYLWHWPVFVLFRWTVGLATVPTMLPAVVLVGAVSVASYRWVETPPRRAWGRSGLPGVTIIGVGLAVALLGWGVAGGIWALRPVISLSTVNRHPGDWYGTDIVTARGACRLETRRMPITDGSAERITRTGCVPPMGAVGHVFVVGDSHATMYEPMARQIAMDTGDRVDLLAAGGCGVFSLADADTPACRAFREAALAMVMASAEPGDVVFFPSLRVPRLADQFVVFDVAATLAQVASAPAAAARDQQEAAMETALGALAARRVRIVLEAPTPVFPAPAFRCSDWFNRANPVCAGGLTVPRATIEALRAPVLRAFARIAAATPLVRVWDPLPILCPGRECSAARDGRPLFFDGDHLSGFGNVVLTGSFEGLLR
jgi:peptidoglycan/LPS O-acetylase OafA/YrhL